MSEHGGRLAFRTSSFHRDSQRATGQRDSGGSRGHTSPCNRRGDPCWRRHSRCSPPPQDGVHRFGIESKHIRSRVVHSTLPRSPAGVRVGAHPHFHPGEHRWWPLTCHQRMRRSPGDSRSSVLPVLAGDCRDNRRTSAVGVKEIISAPRTGRTRFAIRSSRPLIVHVDGVDEGTHILPVGNLHSARRLVNGRTRDYGSCVPRRRRGSPKAPPSPVPLA